MNVFEERGITHLDLHGVRHHDVEDDVFDFVLRHQNLLPLIIICGNSNSMIKIVSNTLQKNSIEFSSPRFGIIRVERIN
jgi:hypothetical protein